MSLIICKFGGTSVASPERIQMVARKLIAKKQQGHDVVAVVSAMGKTTDELVGLANQLNDNPPSREMDRLLSTADLEEFMGLGATAGIWYAAGLVIYLLVTRNIYARRYDEAARAVRVYTAKLRRLKKRYEFQNRKKELTKGGRHHDGTSRI